jgi:hypothetical protein
MRVPALVDIPAAYKLGDEREFYATNLRNGTQYLLETLCYGVSDKAYILVESSRCKLRFKLGCKIRLKNEFTIELA